MVGGTGLESRLVKLVGTSKTRPATPRMSKVQTQSADIYLSATRKMVGGTGLEPVTPTVSSKKISQYIS